MMQKLLKAIGSFLGILLLLCTSLRAQDAGSVHWLSFEALEDSLAVQPKKVFIDFYTDWCSYCRKMDKKVFTNPEVIELLNEEYYAVRFNAESEKMITFSGQQLVNDQIGRFRTPIHQIARLLALREGKFVAPTLVILDETFRVTSRYFEYMDSQSLLKALKNK
jgi:thioredoxin-related protein